MFGQIKMVITIVMIMGIAGAGMYVMKLRADNATLKANQIELERGIEEQNKVLEQQKADFEAIMESNKKLNENRCKIEPKSPTVAWVTFSVDFCRTKSAKSINALRFRPFEPARAPRLVAKLVEHARPSPWMIQDHNRRRPISL